MNPQYYGPLYLVTRGGTSNPEARHEDVVETYRHGRSHIDVAKELWSLAGDAARAEAIAAIVDRAFDRDIPVLFAVDINEMLELLDGMEEALKRTIVDDKMVIRPERMSEVRQRAQLIDVDEERGKLAEVAVMEGVARVSQLEDIFKAARDRGLDVALD